MIATDSDRTTIRETTACATPETVTYLSKLANLKYDMTALCKLLQESKYVDFT